MSDEIKRYAPTPRHLERLRHEGLSSASEAVTAVAVIVAATAGLALLGGRLCGWLQGVMAQDLRLVATAPADLPALFAGRLLQAGIVVVVVGAAATGIAVATQVAQGKFPQRSSKQMYLPMSTGGGGRRRSLPLSLWPGLLGLGAAGMLLAGWLRDLAARTDWPGGPVEAGAAAHLWLRWLVVLGAVAVLHAVAVRLRTMGQARMSHQEMVEERRETEGSWLKRRRAHQWLRGRR